MKNLITIVLLLNMYTVFSQINNEHLEVGDNAPLINATDQFGKIINSREILKYQKILLIFYRGNWCPHCRKHLKTLQDNFITLSERGYYILVVSPEKVEKTKETSKMLDASFSILHDKENKIMKDYKVAFEVNKNNVMNYFRFTQNKVEEYNEANSNLLPVPATYVISMDGKIALVHYDPDYRQRFDINSLLLK